MKPGQARLGAQLWLERDAGPKRVDFLVGQAADTGLDLLRVFLMWPWMEPTPGEWVFEPFDAVFDAAQRRGLGIKATLTANSGPWHLGTPSVLHSTTLTLDSRMRPAMRRYIEKCVDRYRDSAALQQWIIWNEPMNYVVPPNTVNVARSDEQRLIWARLLKDRYEDVQVLNQRWRTGFTSFDEIPFAEDLPHIAHRGTVWESYAPWLDDYRLRVRTLHHELSWITDVVHGIDAHTPVCFNPPDTLSNHATVGYDLGDLASIPDVLGATFHAPWQLQFAPQDAHVPLMVAGTTQLTNASVGTPVEVTEFQLGNTYYAGHMPLGLDQSHVCSSFLAPLLAGAESATGWALNSRGQDFEVGEWGLLDDADQIGYRAAGVGRVRDVLAAMDETLGSWKPMEPQALVLTSGMSHAVQLVTAFPMSSLPGREVNDAIHGTALLTTELLGLGIPSAMMPVTSLTAGARPDATLLVVSHMTAWNDVFAHELLHRVENGARLIIDGTSGHKDPDAALHRPWPGILADPLGFRATGLRTDLEGYPVTGFGAPIGRFPLVIAEYEFSDSAWSSMDHLRMPGQAAAPCVWTRTYGKGAIFLVAGPLGPALVHDEGSRPLARQLLSDVAGIDVAVRPLSAKTISLPIRGEHADAVGIFAPAVHARHGQPLRVTLPPGEHVDLWTGSPVRAGPSGETTLPAPDGIAVIAGTGLARATNGGSA